jgi:hypothetical protein
MLVSILLAVVGCAGAPGREAVPVPAEKVDEHRMYVEIEAKLKRLLGERCPGAIFTISSARLIVRYKVSPGHLTYDSVTSAPDKGGFEVFVRATPEPMADFGNARSTMKMHGTFYKSHRIEWKQDMFLSVFIFYSGETDRKLMEEIHDAIAAYAKERM